MYPGIVATRFISRQTLISPELNYVLVSNLNWSDVLYLVEIAFCGLGIMLSRWEGRGLIKITITNRLKFLMLFVLIYHRQLWHFTKFITPPLTYNQAELWIKHFEAIKCNCGLSLYNIRHLVIAVTQFSFPVMAVGKYFINIV